MKANKLACPFPGALADSPAWSREVKRRQPLAQGKRAGLGGEGWEDAKQEPLPGGRRGMSSGTDTTCPGSHS